MLFRYKQKTAYEILRCDWSSDVCSSDLSQGRLAAQRVLADREQFVLDADAQQEWARINSRPARSLPGLAWLLERPSPFLTPAADHPQA